MTRKGGLTSCDGFQDLSLNVRFAMGIGIALMIALGLIALIRANNSIEGLTPASVLPSQVQTFQYTETGNFEENRDKLVLGVNPQEASLTCDAENVLWFRYTFAGGVAGDKTAKNLTSGSIDSPATVTLYSVSGDQIEYHIDANKDAGSKSSGKWSAILKVPRDVDAEHPSGTWSLYVTSTTGKWEHSTWVRANPDGTGVFGSMAKNLSNATSRDIADASLPCTIELEPSATGNRIRVNYEGGHLLLVM